MNNLALSTDLTNRSGSPASFGLRSSGLSYLDIRDNIFTDSQSRRKSKSKSEQLKIRSKTRSKLVALLSRLGEDNKSESMSACGQKFEVLTCGEHIAAKMAYQRCNIRFCPMCASRRSSKYLKKYLPFAFDFVKSAGRLTPCLLTLTQKKIKGEKLKDSRERMLKSFRCLIRHAFFNEYFDGGIYAIENTFSDDGNHCHIHAVVFRKKFINADLLKEHWAKVSNGAKNLNIKKIDRLEDGLRECLKYISKPVPADGLELAHVKDLLSISGKRMLDTFGSFRKFCATHELAEEEKSPRESLAEGDCCPFCTSSRKFLFAQTMSETELIRFYRQGELVRGSPLALNH